jgi:outer membrane porin, OprD family
MLTTLVAGAKPSVADRLPLSGRNGAAGDGASPGRERRGARRHRRQALALAMMSLAFGAAATAQPDAPPASAWPLEGASVETMLRLFADKQDVEGVVNRHAQNANLRVQIDSGATPGSVGIGLNVGIYAVGDLFSSRNAGNMAHLNSDGTRGGPLWAYLGEYGVRLQGGESVLRYGQQRFSNPFLESHDNRGLPPIFRGASASSLLTKGLRAEAGSVNATIPRGMTVRRPLSTNYAGIPVRRFDFAGLGYESSDGTNACAYVGKAQDVWSQYFLSAQPVFGDPNAAHIASAAAAYRTRDTGRARQGQIDTTAYSVSLSPGWGATSLTAAYQRIRGNQFFDYLGETSGMWLSNAYAVDYNAPREQSLLLAVSTNLGAFGRPNFKAMAWRIQGWGADATSTARQHADPGDPLYALYWKAGEPVHGGHHEIGLLLERDDLVDKGATEKLILMRHWSNRFYPDPPFYEIKLVMERTF